MKRVSGAFKPPRPAGAFKPPRPSGSQQLVLPVEKPVSTAPVTTSSTPSSKYTVQWRKQTTKKHKSWDGDGILTVLTTGSILKADKGSGYKVIARSSKTSTSGIFLVGSYEVQVDEEITESQPQPQPRQEPQKRPEPLPFNNDPMNRPFKKVAPNTLRDDPKSDAFVLPAKGSSKEVIVDPSVAQHLRSHQKEGLVFLYQCLMGHKNFKGQGALLADEMGLGKTLTTISLIWTMLKQNPDPSSRSGVAKKVLIVCPVTLIDNWHREFKKWLNINKIGILTIKSSPNSSIEKDKQSILSFGRTQVYQVLIMGYEKILNCSNELSQVPIDVLVCDEGHRLKNSSNKVLKILTALNVPKKVVLTGTPIQNDLQEFYNIINFINPGVLGSNASFQKTFLNPILRSRDINCKNRTVIESGEKASSELIELTKNFVLRRTKDCIQNYLPSKTDVIVFCPPTQPQIKLFNYITSTRQFDSYLNGNNSLSLITLVKKLCNSPSLLKEDKVFATLVENNSEMMKLTSNVSSSKMNLLIPLLLEFRNINAKTVLVSNYTQTLDLLQTIISKLNLSFLRLDGSTPSKSRNSLVSQFNKDPSISVFLLSSKSGGVGLNLVGASRLILFDNDWNPSNDLQALARIHRDGQKNLVFIYRLLTTGLIDEKIFQRQLMKNNLSDKFIDDSADSKLDLFDSVDLKDLFTFSADTSSNTHDLLECDCTGIGNNPKFVSQETVEEFDEGNNWMSALDYIQKDQSSEKKKNSIRNALTDYKHYDPLNFKTSIDVGDEVLNKIIENIQNNKENSLPISFLLTKFTPGQ